MSSVLFSKDSFTRLSLGIAVAAIVPLSMLLATSKTSSCVHAGPYSSGRFPARALSPTSKKRNVVNRANSEGSVLVNLEPVSFSSTKELQFPSAPGIAP
eukprot:CAMPEP_0178394428 /NCGR_PEP_ID=MMETSP0689_2-20121128/12701_1 /TAXON_ID=160604 /ORGANISM="Amphidinium massartii, Strain CS-259" /LENGTH=98 /DNA_ID=CAMNT_0020015057 /DNA_START=347 /DNA_END=639 /DNA_ORIENTATION=+